MANTGVTQSQYSRIETRRLHQKILDKLGKIFGCLPEEVFGPAILREIEDEYLNDTKKIQRMEYHEKRLDRSLPQFNRLVLKKRAGFSYGHN